MANITDLFPSNWIKAPDLRGRRVTVTMAAVKVEEVGDDKKPVLYFSGTDKGLVLNVTNANSIKELYGPETNDWRGRAITLYVAKVEYQGKRMDGIRVDPPDTTGGASPARQAPPPPPSPPAPFLPVADQFASGPELTDDDIPF
jgi:hypothetical protein